MHLFSAKNIYDNCMLSVYIILIKLIDSCIDKLVLFNEFYALYLIYRIERIEPKNNTCKTTNMYAYIYVLLIVLILISPCQHILYILKDSFL